MSVLLLKKFDFKTFALILSIGALVTSYFNFEKQCEAISNIIPSSLNSVNYNRSEPIIFIGGVPRSGTTLMRVMLDAHPLIRCGEETRILPRILDNANKWLANSDSMSRLKDAGITRDIFDTAISSFMLEIIVRHGKIAKNLCNKDPFVLKHTVYVSQVFPSSKFILMIRDARASVHSIIARKVSMRGFSANDYRESFRNWNRYIERMHAECMSAGSARCLPVYYEQLVLRPENEMRKILNFLNIPFNDAVLNHEKYIGDEISLSKLEKSSDQVVKPINLEALTFWFGNIPKDILDEMEMLAPMMKKLGYDTKSYTPNYGVADKKVKDNTFNVQANKEHWLNIAKNYSIHV
jgi:protein-tyrosine sulfotransferase